MKKTIALLLAILMTALMAACSSTGTKEPGTTDGTTPSVGESVEEGSASASKGEATPTPTPTPSAPAVSPSKEEESPTPSEPVDNETITATITAKNYEVTESGKGTVEITGKTKVAAGDKLVVTAPTNYLKVQAKGMTKATIVYLPDKTFTYVHASNANVFTSGVFAGGKLTFTLSTPTAEELAEVRNLALNPYDAKTGTTAFPHADTNNEYDQSGQFIARNAIDGYTSNKGHGGYSYQSWGPRATVLATDYYTIDFGREVTLSSIALYLRADGFGSPNSHDAYFSEITLVFSDGTSTKINPTKTASKQEFTFEEKTTTSIKLTGFVTDKSDSQGWAAITEIEVMGKEA